MIARESTPNQFDKFGLKAGMVDAWKRGECKRICVECNLGRVIAFTTGTIPVDFWGRILQFFGPSRDKPWRIVWFASEALRCFPDAGKEMGPEHVNGGYTTPCSADGIFIYRKEEASRVLIHELMHAACLDENWSLHDREAMVETWAELILVALLSKGDGRIALTLWKKQAQWVADSNHRALNKNGVKDPSDYAWRYLVGRHGMYKRLGVEIPNASGHVPKSSRFTHPDLEPRR